MKNFQRCFEGIDNRIPECMVRFLRSTKLILFAQMIDPDGNVLRGHKVRVPLGEPDTHTIFADSIIESNGQIERER